MSPGEPRTTSRHPHPSATETLRFKVAALMVVSAVTILLWFFAVPRVGEATGLSPNRPGLVPAQATVVSCPGGVDLAEACVVGYTKDDGTQGTAPLLRTGLFDVSEGEQLPVLVDPGGRAVIGGWRPVVDALLLTGLALAFTVYSVNWFRRVLEHGDEPFDGGDPPAHHLTMRP